MHLLLAQISVVVNVGVFGHDEYLNDSSFLSGMKSLEVLIISGSPIKDLSPLSACKNLRILEIAN